MDLIYLFMNCKYQQIAEFLCQLTEDHLWNSTSFSDVIAFDRYKLKTRIGCGMATYCKFNPKENMFTINYGKKMIESKFNQQQVKLWMTYREVDSRHYYNRVTTLINILAHTVCHEFAHVIQQVTKSISKGSIHNAHFYSILDKIHTSDESVIIRQKLEHFFLKNAISPEYEDKSLSTNNVFDVQIGTTASFSHKKKVISGVVIKINKKTVQIKVKKFLTDTVWKVPKQCLDIHNK